MDNNSTELISNIEFHKFVWETYCRIRKKEKVSSLMILKTPIRSLNTYSKKRIAQLFLYSFFYKIMKSHWGNVITAIVLCSPECFAIFHQPDTEANIDNSKGDLNF